MKVIHLIEDVVSNVEKQEMLLKGVTHKGKMVELSKLDKKYHAMMNAIRKSGYDYICREYMAAEATKQEMRSKFNLSIRNYTELCKAEEIIRAIEKDLEGKEINFIYIER